MKKTLLILCAAFFLLGLQSTQAATYSYRNDVFAYDTPSGAATSLTWHAGTKGATNGAPACTSYPLGDDDWADLTFPAGFTFTFAGVTQSAVRVYSNGILVFGADTSGQWRTYGNSTLPYATNIGTYTTGCPGGVLNNAIVGYWTDIIAGTALDSNGNSVTGASVKYELLGTAPFRRLVISWVNVQLYSGGTAVRYNFQMQLYESPSGGINSNFKYQYTTGSSDGSGATVGVQVSTADSTLFSYKQTFIDPVAGSAILWYPSNQFAAKGAEYHFDEATWSGAAGEIKDTSSNLQNAVRVGAAANIAAGMVCRGGSFTGNTSNTTIDAVATPIVPANVGSIDFWYQSTSKWVSADTMLFDASLSASKQFYLMKTAAGKLKFVVTDSTGALFTVTENTAQNFAAATWEHIGVSWNMRPGTNQTLFQIFLNGVVVPSTTVVVPAPTPTPTAPRTTSSGSMAALATLYIGDNRISGTTPTGATPNGANGYIDEVYIYATEINAGQATADKNSTHACAVADHIHIKHNGTSLTCNVAPITFEVHDVNHGLVALSGATMTLSTSTGHGDWSNVTGGAVNVVTNGGNGSGAYVFSNESSITLGLQDTIVESPFITAISGAVTNTSGTSCGSTSDSTYGGICNASISFTSSGFLFNRSAVTGNPQVDIASHYAGVSQTFKLSAVKSSDNSLTCIPAFQSVTKSINFSCSYVNPATGTLPISVTGNVGGATAVPLSATSVCDTGAAVNLAFDANGEASSVSMVYPDAGQMKLTAAYSGATGGMTGSTTFVAAPKSFSFSGVTAGPIKAGTNFSATVTAMNAATTPAVTPNFGNESPSQGLSANGLAMSFTKCQPTNGSNPALGGGTTTSANGSATATNLTWGEVGNGEVGAKLASYLGSGFVVTGSTPATGGAACSGAGGKGSVGDFIPDHFETVVTDGCTGCGFTYSSQPFSVRVTAMSYALTPTSNYDGATVTPTFANNVYLTDANAVATPVGKFGISAVPLGVTVNAAGDTLTIPKADFFSGVATLTVVPTYTFNPAPTIPTTIKLRAKDSVNASVVSTGFAEGTTEIRSGRIKIGNAYGSELLPLNITATAQYYNALSSWVISNMDSSTQFNTNLSGAGGNVSAAIVDASHGLGLGNISIVSPGMVTFASGNGKFKLAAPGKAGSADLSIVTAPSYMLPSTTGRATFGVYKGTNEFIYTREAY